MTSLESISSQETINYQLAHELLGKDLLDFFSYVEPADANLKVFGPKSYQLYFRICTEFESACKCVIKRPGIAPSILDKSSKIKEESKWNITDYVKLNDLVLPNRKDSACKVLNLKRGKLSDYKFIIFNWRATHIFAPLATFEELNSPKFYQDDSKTKHNRQELFESASLENLINSFLAITYLLDWQDIAINKEFLTDSENESFFGARFGFFWITNVTAPAINEKMYF